MSIQLTLRCLALSLSLLLCIGCAQEGSNPTLPVPVGTVENNGSPAKQSGDAGDHAGKVLRHAVFFSFKDDVTDAQLQEVVGAFRQLPNEIPEMIDFQWGVNNSPEDLNAGFTHAFLTTFQDEAARAAYLPHPAHKAFGDVLRGKNKSVFVIDYWGTPQDPLESELKHAVFLKFKADASPEDITKVEQAFAALPSQIDEIVRFEWGINNSPERHSAGFQHCFMVSFASAEARATYLSHPRHLEFAELLKPVLEVARVIDFQAEGPLPPK